MNQDLNTPPTESVTRLTTVNERDNPEHFEAGQTPEQQIEDARRLASLREIAKGGYFEGELWENKTILFLLSQIDLLTESLEKANELARTERQRAVKDFETQLKKLVSELPRLLLAKSNSIFM